MCSFCHSTVPSVKVNTPHSSSSEFVYGLVSPSEVLNGLPEHLWGHPKVFSMSSPNSSPYDTTDTITKSPINLWPNVLWYQIHLWTRYTYFIITNFTYIDLYLYSSLSELPPVVNSKKINKTVKALIFRLTKWWLQWRIYSYNLLFNFHLTYLVPSVRLC